MQRFQLPFRDSLARVLGLGYADFNFQLPFRDSGGVSMRRAVQKTSFQLPFRDSLMGYLVQNLETALSTPFSGFESSTISSGRSTAILSTPFSGFKRPAIGSLKGNVTFNSLFGILSSSKPS